MKKSTVSMTVANFIDQFKQGEIDFDYPIQRKGEQWTLSDASLLMHSLIDNYPVPPVYALVNELETENEDGDKIPHKVYSILDGKQRLTYIQAFVENNFELTGDTPSVTVTVGRGKFEEIEIKNKHFNELDEKVQKALLNAELSMVQIDDATDEMIENIFFRLNNGRALTKTQQGKSIMGSEWAKRFTDVSKHPAMTVNAQFTELQKRKADDETTIIQAMMIMDALEHGYDLKSISSNHAFDYIQDFKDEEKSKHYKKLFDKVVEALDYIHEAFGDNAEKFLLKKVHMTSAIMTALHAKEMGIAPIRYRDWTAEFEKTYKGKGDYIKSNYKNAYTGQGSVSRYKALGRVTSMIEHFDKYLSQSKTDVELEKALSKVKENVGGNKKNKEKKDEEPTVEVTTETGEPIVEEDVETIGDESVQDEIIELTDDEVEQNDEVVASEEKPLDQQEEDDEVQVTLDGILG